MNWVTGIVVYLIIWWTVLFAVLPWKVHVPEETEPGHADSAPAYPHLLRKAIATTVIAAVIWIGFYFLQRSNLISFRATS
jgi:predicted secreted protein